MNESVTELHLYDSYSRSQRIFEPMGSPVRMYACGPTVYDYAHIGNLRTYVFEDVLRRVSIAPSAGYRDPRARWASDPGDPRRGPVAGARPAARSFRQWRYRVHRAGGGAPDGGRAHGRHQRGEGGDLPHPGGGDGAGGRTLGEAAVNDDGHGPRGHDLCQGAHEPQLLDGAASTQHRRCHPARRRPTSAAARPAAAGGDRGSGPHRCTPG